jgi:hypothetical protein
MIRLQPQHGFIAITSAIIISVLLLAITLAITFSGYFARFNVLDSESKERSSALAEACIETAILSLSLAQPPPPNPVNIGPSSEDNCNIISITPSGGQTVIQTQSIINKSYTNLNITVDDSTFNILSWQEVPDF